MDVNISKQNVKPFNGIRLAAAELNGIISADEQQTDPPTEESFPAEIKDDTGEN